MSYKISIVTTLYRSEEYIEKFFELAKSNALELSKDIEFIFVNDGSPDASLEKAKFIADRYPYVSVIDLSKNFGHHKAMMTGLSYSQGEYVFLIDSDLEEDPGWLKLFWGHLKSKDNVDVVYGVQSSRKGDFFEKFMGLAFWITLRKLTGNLIPINQVTARLMRRRYVDAICLHKEKEFFFAGVASSVGFNQIGVSVVKQSTSKSTYNFISKVKMAVNNIISFSSYPLVIVFFFGLVTVAIVIFLVLLVLYRYFFWGIPIEGWTTIILSIWGIGGLGIMSMGVIGLYLSKIFNEVKNRQFTIVREVYQKSEKQ